MTDRTAEITLRVITALEELAVDYVIGGSLASSVYGSYRATQASDLVADVRLQDIPDLVERLQSEFYISAEAAREAIECRSSFNLIHLETSYKVDIFVPKRRAFDHSQLNRGKPRIFGGDPLRSVMFSSAEDTILAKLEWYRLGGEVSNRQWNDVRNILRVQGVRLDRAYLQDMAVNLGVQDLLARAEAEIS